jgi:transposase
MFDSQTACICHDFIDVKDASVLYMGKDRREESLKRGMGPEKCSSTEAVAMDMWRPYLKAGEAHCPQALIVFDPFHIIQAYWRDVVDRVRAEEYRRASASAKEIIKGSRYILLKNNCNLDRSRNEHVHLNEMLSRNRKISKVYFLKDDLKALWKHRGEPWARKWFASW